MSSKSANDPFALSGDDLKNYAFARAKDIAYDSVQELWRYRKAHGWKQIDVAKALGDADAGWVSRALRGPGNWTFRTFASLIEALGGHLEIRVRPAEIVKAENSRANYHAYSDYERSPVLHLNPEIPDGVARQP